MGHDEEETEALLHLRRAFLAGSQGSRRRGCGQGSCQSARRRRMQAAWRASNPEYFTLRRLALRVRAAEKAEEAQQSAGMKRRRPLPRLPNMRSALTTTLLSRWIGM